MKGVTGPGTCSLSFAVGSPGRVDVFVDAARVSGDQVCDIVGKIADIVEPKLPA
ncbi:MAG TPA: hypothetical protein VJ870_05255 [Amycolatopsis sp.]|nr:hypothetical protein [Amycolatopsis sp.]